MPDDEPADDAPVGVGSRRAWFEVATVVLLAATALATAWSGYQASLWDGIQSSSYTQASGARTDAAQLRTAANQYRLADLTVFENYVDARVDGNDELAAFYEQRFRDEFRVAFDAWLALDPFTNPDAPPSPIAMPEYQPAADVEAAALEAKADQLFEDGERANGISDTFTLTTLLFAVVLFLAAISERFRLERARLALLVLSAVALVVGIIVTVGQPTTGG